MDVVNVLPAGANGTIELLYMQARTHKPENSEPEPEILKLKFVFDLQLYAPTTLAPARDFWLLRYTSILDDGSLVVSCSDHGACKTNYPCVISTKVFVCHYDVLPACLNVLALNSEGV
jgi:homeobox-leucine zipper protein